MSLGTNMGVSTRDTLPDTTAPSGSQNTNNEENKMVLMFVQGNRNLSSHLSITVKQLSLY